MKVQVEKLSPVEKKVTVEVGPDRIAKEIDRAYTSLGRRVKIKGFRPGKAPRGVLERNFRDQVEAEVIDRIVSSTFAEVAKAESIEAVAAPRVQVAEPGLGEGRPLSYTARVEVKPVIEPKDYRGLDVERKTAQVTDAMVDAEIERLRQSFAQMEPVEGRTQAQKGDWAVIDYMGTVDGKSFDGGQAEGALVQVADGDFFKGEMAILEGRNLGDVLEVEQVFPEGFRDPEMRGKTARFSITLQSLRSQKIPAVDDAFAREIGIEGVETLEALRARVRSDIEKREKHRAESEQRDLLIRAALSRNEFEVPPALVERTLDAMMESTARRFAQQGIDIRQLDLDVARIRADLRDQAVHTVRAALVLEAIAAVEKIEVSAEDEKAELERQAAAMGVPLSKLKLRDEMREALRQQIREDKAVALLAEHAVYR